MRHFALVTWLAIACGSIAHANGRPPATSTITFQQGNGQRVIAGMTFGVLFSSDGGHTWTWMCEAAFPYSGIYDPDFLETTTGALFATTLQGVKVSRDGCTLAQTPVATRQCDGPKLDPCFDKVFFSHVVAGSGSAIYATASSPYDSRIYRSTDDGHTFKTLSDPGVENTYWQSFVIAPSSPNRIYAAGYRFATQCDGNASNAGSACRLNANCTSAGSALAKCVTAKLFTLLRSDDAGATWSPMSQANVVVTPNSTISIVGVDPNDAGQVYIRVSLESGTGDAMYKSANGGAAWTKIFDTSDPRGLVALVRSNGGLVVATESSGTFSSTGGSACVDRASCKWATAATAPHINCLAEQPGTNDIWACTAPSDGAGIMKTTDLTTWTPMLRFAEIAAPVSCGSDTVQTQQCVAPHDRMPSAWCCVAQQLGITSTAIACTGAYACTQGMGEESPPVASPSKPKAGCCNTTDDTAGWLLVGAPTLLLLRRRRRPA